MDDTLNLEKVPLTEATFGLVRHNGQLGVNVEQAAKDMSRVTEALNEGQKLTNPKDAIGSDKMPLHLWPQTATMMGCIGLLNGMGKYGRSNYRVLGVRASIYYDACKRHLDAWFEGEDYDEDGVPNLGASLACLAIIVDAQANDNLTDDRMVPGGYRKLMDELTPIVKVLKERHKDKDPHHYTIADA